MPSSLFDLSNRTAVVTGASRGIGAGIARALAGAGADIIGVSKNINASDIGDEIRALGREYTPVAVDLSDRHAVVAASERVAALNPDILINNAGTIGREPAATHGLDMWDEVLGVNLSSQFVLTQAIGNSMIRKGYGKIVFIASVLSFQGGINVPSYTTSKAGILGLTKALANEWAPLGINVNAIAPGYIATDNTQPLRNDPDRSSAILDRIPSGRWGSPADLGGAAVFLSSRASDYVSGSTVTVDGGWLAR